LYENSARNQRYSVEDAVIGDEIVLGEQGFEWGVEEFVKHWFGKILAG